VATVEALQDAGVTPDDLALMSSLTGLDIELAGGPSGAVDDLAAGFEPCDLDAGLEPALVAAFGIDLANDTACVVDEVDDDGFETAVAETVVEGSDRMAEEFMVAVGRCPGALAAVAATFVTGGDVDLPPDAMACLEEELADIPEIVDLLLDGGSEAIGALDAVAATCGIDDLPDLDTTGRGPGPDDTGDDEPGEPGQVGGGWDPDLGFDTGGSSPSPDDRPTPEPAPIGTPPDALEVTTLDPGTGPRAQLGDGLVVHYVGVLPDGQVLDSSYELGQPLVVPELGDGMLIPGWEEGLVGVQAGERRRLVIGSALAYGPEGSSDVPPDTPLAFEIDVLEVTPG